MEEKAHRETLKELLAEIRGEIGPATEELVARGHNGVLLTSDADDMRQIDPSLDLVVC